MVKKNDSFAMQKEHALSEYKAAVHAGDVDGVLIPLLNHVNSLSDFYTTSSCAGRITVLADDGSKDRSRLLGKWHSKVNFDDLCDALKLEESIVWFIYEPAIVHIVSRTLEGAMLLARIGRQSGFKRTGVQGFKDGRFVVEICSTEKIQTPVMEDGMRLVSDDYLKKLIELANLKFEKGGKKLARLEENIVGKLK